MSDRSVKPSKPNLLFIFTDQQRADSLGCYGNTAARTPNLDALAARGVLFENAYISQPVCTPSRATLMTGQWPHTNGCTRNNIPLRPETQTLAEMVPEDYATGYIGKWHLGDEIIAQHGFDTWESIEDMYRPHYTKPEYLERVSTYHDWLIERGYEPNVVKDVPLFSRVFAATLPPEHTKAAFVGERSAQFIADHAEDADKPFLLCVNFLEPHSPFMGQLGETYGLTDWQAGPAFLQPPPEDASLWHRHRADWCTSKKWNGQDLNEEAGWRELRRQYIGNVELVDRAVGRILEALEESGLADNTIVVFTSDHGDMMGDHALLTKGVMYEEACRVPMLVRVPWLEMGRRVDGRLGHIDVVPTLLDLMGVNIPDAAQGESRADVIAGDATLDGNDVVIEWTGQDDVAPNAPEVPGVSNEERIRMARQSIRTLISSDGWKLNLYTDDQHELYDLNAEPMECVNHFSAPAHKDRVADMTARLRAWQQETGDEVQLKGI